MRMSQALRALAPLTESQRGMITTGQAQQLGISRLVLSRLDQAGDLERVLRGVYRLVGSANLQHDDLYAHWLALDPQRPASLRLRDQHAIIAISHRSAAAVYGIGDLPVFEHAFTANYRKQTELPGARVHIDRALKRDHVRAHSSMTVTSPERTIFDLLRTEGDASQLADVLGDALRRGLTNVGALNQAMSEWSGTSRGVEIEGLLTQAGLGPTSDWRVLNSRDSESPTVATILALPNEAP